MKDKTIYLPGLNGLRTIAAIGVVISHIALEMPKFNLSPFLFGEKAGKPVGYLLASYGVTIFFVLSGFLITYLLEKEQEKQEIDIKKFYFRRALRIWPLYYLYLFIVLFVLLFSSQDFQFKGFAFYLALMANIPFIFKFALPFVSHYWSIGVEEQFYLFWPILVKKCRNNLVTIIIILIIFQILLRGILWYFIPGSSAAIFSMVNRFDCMMIGALGAILYFRRNALFIKCMDNKISQFIALLIIGLLIINKFHINALIDNLIISIVTLATIIGQINIKNRLVSLDNSVFDFLGKISFGIYIYHPLVILFYSLVFKSLMDVWYSYLLIFISVGLTTIVIAYLSYEYYEKFFIRYKSKFSVVMSKGARVV